MNFKEMSLDQMDVSIASVKSVRNIVLDRNTWIRLGIWMKQLVLILDDNANISMDRYCYAIFVDIQLPNGNRVVHYCHEWIAFELVEIYCHHHFHRAQAQHLYSTQLAEIQQQLQNNIQIANYIIQKWQIIIFTHDTT